MSKTSPRAYVQSVLFKKDKWSTFRALMWLQKHGYHAHKEDTTDKFLRFRQMNPTFSRYSTKKLPGGIELVIGYK